MPHEKNTIKQCKVALKRANGNISKAAALLGSERSALCHRVSRNKSLRKVQQDALDTLLDFAESQLWVKIQEGHYPSIKLALTCQGKNRGWIENPAQVPKDKDVDAVFRVEVIASDANS